MRAFENGLGEIRDVCSFQDIRQSRFHAKLFKTADVSEISRTV